MSEGKSFESFASTVGVTYQTLLNWAKQFPEFGEAKDEGLGHRKFFIDTLIVEVASGKRKGNAALIKLMAINVLDWKGSNDESEMDKKASSLKNDVKITLAYDPRNKKKDNN